MSMRLSLFAATCCIVAVMGCGVLPPATPEAPTGPTTGDVGVSYRLTASTVDPQNLPVRYQFDWGDGNRSEWGQYVPSGAPVTMAHAWRRSGLFGVRVHVQNVARRESDLSRPHNILIGSQSGYPDNVIARIRVGSAPFGVCILPNGEYVYVANRSGSISVISTATKTVVRTIACRAEPAFVAATPNSEYVYFSMTSDRVGVVRTSDNTIVKTTEVQNHPLGVAVNPDGSRVYVANYYSGTVSVIRTRDNTVVANVAIPGYPWCVEVTPDGEYVYASGRGTDIMAVIRTSDNQVVALVEVGSEPGDIAFSPDGQFAYLSCRLDNDVAVVRTSDLQVAARIPGCSHPTGIAILADGSHAYLSNYHAGYVLIARTSDNTVVDTLQFGTITDFSAAVPNRTEVYIGCPQKNEVWVVGLGEK
jgi:YVTN family beta-propeller protein